MNYYELRIYKDIYKKIPLQYHKTVACIISVSESSRCMMEVDKKVLDVPAEIGRKLSRTSLEISTLAHCLDKQYTTTISCNIS